MFENKNITGPGRGRRLASALGLSLLVVAGAACGAGSQSSGGSSGGNHGTATRTTPSSEQVAVVIAQAKDRLPSSFLPTEDHVRAFGDATCSAFDQGKTEPQVRELVMQAASQLPTSISAADADFAVHSAVSLFCPGYTARLGS